MPTDLERRNFSRAHKGEMIRRASDEKGIIRCERCKKDLTGQDIEFDHTIAENLILDKTRKLTAADGKLLGKWCCHRGPDGKTAQDREAIDRAKRLELGRAGEGPALKGKPLPLGRPKHRATAPLEKPPLPRRNPFTGEVVSR